MKNVIYTEEAKKHNPTKERNKKYWSVNIRKFPTYFVDVLV